MTLAVNIAQGGSNNVTMRNRIINGAMQIAQRGTSFTNPVVFTLDRWSVYNYISTTVASQSSTTPAGFTNSLLITNGTGASPAGTNYNYQISQCIEGYNISDLAWGTANAKPITLSFWVRSSLTGNFGLAFTNGGAGGSNSPNAPTRSYVTTYNIPSANTWTYITVPILGDTTGTWNTNNSNGLTVIHDLGSGSDYNTSTTNAWQTGNYARTSSTVNLNATTGATFYITGVQLEAGTTASPFEYRQYGTELGLCQRYYCKSYQQSVAPATSTTLGVTGVIASTASLLVGGFNTWPVTMRTTPAVTIYSQIGTSGKLSAPGAIDTGTTVISETPSEKGAVGISSAGGFTIGSWYYGHFVATAEL